SQAQSLGIVGLPSFPSCTWERLLFFAKFYFAQTQKGGNLASVIADGFHGTAFHRFLAKLLLFGSRGLLVNVGVAAIIVAAKITRCGLAAKITVDTLVIDIVLASEVFGIAVCDVSHNILEIQAYT